MVNADASSKMADERALMRNADFMIFPLDDATAPNRPIEHGHSSIASASKASQPAEELLRRR
jgi:hypothetical protein